jgi:SAM-dependent methyltransferase
MGKEHRDMNVRSVVSNELVEDKSSVWLLKDHREFGYSEGADAERYLEKVLSAAGDLSTNSSELESHIKDWSSEYHLTTKRAQLLSGFNFDRTLKVLEVGCGCGAITRHLGESFDNVVSIEGSLSRARLAKLRTRDLPSVSIICAPFQEIRFSQKFDVIFVIGVFEYSASFVEGSDPYDSVLKYFADILTPDGMVVLAIENQFGLKYFNGCYEDHLDKPFVGLEGYHRQQARVRTFGKAELENRIKRHFPEVRFFYPYPDYKLPDCVLSAEFLASGRGGEFVSQMKSRNYSGAVQPLWSESATTLELARNDMLEFFANSFLVIAGRGDLSRFRFDQLAILYSSGRKSKFSTITRVVQGADEDWNVVKRTRQSGTIGLGSLKMVETVSLWMTTQSLQTQVRLRAMSNDLLVDEIFSPCRSWVDYLTREAVLQDGVRMLNGAFVDSIWQNVYFEGESVRLVDQEWVWPTDIPLNQILIRGIYYFFAGAPPLGSALGIRSGRRLIERVGGVLGLSFKSEDFDAFVEMEAELQSVVFGTDKRKQRAYLRWFLLDRSTLDLFLRFKRTSTSVWARTRARFT